VTVKEFFAFKNIMKICYPERYFHHFRFLDCLTSRWGH